MTLAKAPLCLSLSMLLASSNGSASYALESLFFTLVSMFDESALSPTTLSSLSDAFIYDDDSKLMLLSEMTALSASTKSSSPGNLSRSFGVVIFTSLNTTI